MNRRYGLAFMLLGIAGTTVALLHLFRVDEPITSITTACLSTVVMLYGIYLIVWLKFYSVGKHAHAESRSNNTND